LNVVIYKGKQTSSAVEEGVSKVDIIVLTLIKLFLNKGQSLYMDNFYNSVTLSILLEKKTHTTGTLRSNRIGNPKEVTTKKLKIIFGDTTKMFTYSNGKTNAKFYV